MKIFIRTISLLLLVLFQFSSAAFAEQTKDNLDKTLSPYFFVKSDDTELDNLPLKSTNVNVNISGVIADVVVEQVYKNEGKKPLEAIYIFPASTRAAVYGMKMQIGERTIIAKIDERKAARQAYEQAKREGQNASLLEQQRPNVFQMNVANILPEDVIKVELKYTELLVPTDTVYEFMYPTVVGARYTGTQGDYQKKAEDWTANPYLREGEAPTYRFDISVTIRAGLPIMDIACNSHKTSINFEGKNDVIIHLDRSEKFGGNRDFILNYRLAGGKIESGLLLYEGKTENYFLLMMQPPKQVKISDIPPREYMFIVDISGSMHGFPLDISKKLLRGLIGNLRPTDRFNVLLFAGGSSVLAEKSLPATKENINRAIHVIERQRGGGSTQILPALKKALSMPGTKGYSRTIIIATDGYVSVEEETFDLIRNSLGDANMFAFGIGSSVNRHLIEGMARVGMGEPFVITHPEDAPKKAAKLRKLIESPVLTNIQIDYGKFDVYDVEPPRIPDVFAQRPVIVFGKWQGKPRGKIKVQGITGNKTYRKSIKVGKLEPHKDNASLRYLWARHRIAVLADYNTLRPNDERIKEVTNLGLTYNLLTAYTSFVAIDTEKRLHDDTQATTVKQPLPLPKGVSDYAVGSSLARKTKAFNSFAPEGAVQGKFRALKEANEREKDQLQVEKPHEEAGDKGIQLALKKIEVSKGVSKSTIKKMIEKQIHTMNQCLSAASHTSGLQGVLNLKLTLDSKGQVKRVEMDCKGQKIDEALKKCLTQELKKLVFPALSYGKTANISVIFVLR
ncbi:MAG: VIT domain-containing protein [Thermodesulfobacteriota bacterium]|nr:VIT domain-containing protein [Thermodesulfobacteriota bacterium]